MKTLLLSILLFTLSFSAVIDERKVDLYFANGVGNTYEDAKEGEENIHNHILAHQRASEILPIVQKYDRNGALIFPSRLAYNNTYGSGADSLET